MPIRFAPLSPHHDRARFRSGAGALDEWFRNRAGQDERRNVARVFVALDQNEAILGFYSLSAFTLSLDELPPALASKLPRYDRIAAALIGRLARHEGCRGQGLGALLLCDALRRILNVATELAVHAVVVEAKDVAAGGFYRSFGFIPFPLHPTRLFLPTATVAEALQAATEQGETSGS